MDETTKDWLSQHFGEKDWIEDGYYRCRILNEEEVELAYLLPGYCGETVRHPQIRFQRQGSVFVPVVLIDQVSEPMRYQTSDEDAAALQQVADALIQKFKHAKGV